MLIDYHIHTIFSDGSGKHEDYLKEAIKKGIKEIGFSDHFSFELYSGSMAFESVPIMIETLRKLRLISKIPVKIGIELDFIPGLEKEKIKKFIEKYNFDYIIGSVHKIGKWDFESFPSEIKKWDKIKLFERYFELVQSAAKSGLYDIIAHPDGIRRICTDPIPRDILIRTAEIIAKSGVCIEINTSGKDKLCKDFHPEKEFLKILFDRGVPITLGSDSHKPESVGRYFDKAVEMAKSVGYKELVQFTERKRKFVKI